MYKSRADSPAAETADRPERLNAATRALDSSPSDRCDEPTRLETLDKAEQQFDLELRKRLEETGYEGPDIWPNRWCDGPPVAYR